MDRATLNLLLISAEAALLVWFNESPWGPRLRGLDLYATIVAFYIYLLLIVSLRRLDRTFFLGPTVKSKSRSPRFDGPRSMGILRRVLIFAGLSLLYVVAPDATPEAVGLNSGLPPHAAFAVGLACYGALLFLFTAKQRFLGGRLPAVKATIRANRFLAPRDPRHSPPIVAAMLINPFAEEFVLRGVLVYLVGTLTGWWIPVIFGGLVVNTILHSYQGRAMAPWHIAYYAVSIGLLFSEAGLWGAFGCHFAGDVVPLLQFRGNFAELRRLRAARVYSTSPNLFSGQ